MFYNNIVTGKFISRPNRFIAHVEIEGKEEICHVKNTSKCKELLQPGVTVYLERSDNLSRKTKFSLIGVKKGERLINIDSQAPNKAVYEWLKQGNLFENATLIRPETKYGNSRLDFYIEQNEKKIFMEVKGATLENDGVVKFPDAPTERGLKHIYELCKATQNGYDAYLLFVIQMKDVKYLTPNMETHRAFGEALIEARNCGVHILAYDCKVTEDSMQIIDNVEVRLGDEEQITQFYELIDPLLSWYDINARILPWRELATPYRVWISEVMLQQTRVEAVKPYFERFIKTLPTIQALAEIDEDALLKLWEGLGYYNRARNLKKAAETIVDLYNGNFPSEYEELLKLPGIGSYTAGAISSIAFGKQVPAVDGNVLRVISRVMASEEDIASQSVKKKMEDDLRAVMPQGRSGAFNQALMEIGATVCVPNGIAKCEVCPLNQLCKAKKLDIVMHFPKKTLKKPRTIEEKTILVIRAGDKVALRKRNKNGLLAGLYEFPNVEGHISEKEVLNLVKRMSLSPIRIQKLESSKHIFTHKEWHMIGYVIKVEELEEVEERQNLERQNLEQDKNEIMNGIFFIEPQETEKQYPIPTAFQRYTKYMNMVIGNKKFEN